MATVLESLRMATIVKMNETEAVLMARHLGLEYEAPLFARRITQQYGPAAVCVTRAERGAWLATRDGAWHEVAGISVAAADPVGAGDAFLAALIRGHIEGTPWHETLGRANELGAWVASRDGAMPGYEHG